MFYTKIIAVCSQIHTKHINTLCGQNVELDIKPQSVPRSKHYLGYNKKHCRPTYVRLSEVTYPEEYLNSKTTERGG